MNCNLWFDNTDINADSTISIESLMDNKYKTPEDLKKFLELESNRHKSFSVLFTLDSINGELKNIRADIRNPIKDFDDELVNIVKQLPPCNYTLLKKQSLSPFKDVYQLRLHGKRWAEREVVEIGKEIMLDRTVVKVKGKLTDNNNTDNFFNNCFAEYSTAGHTYPDIVRGLEVKSFGIYNCDQIYRLQNRVNIMAKYIDENGVNIVHPKLLSLIDLDYNAAFSFHPNYFVCNAKANNILLMFTESGEIYALEKGKFQQLNIKRDGIYIFKMKNVSKEITNSDKLKTYLGI
jgi:hypothetical protein